VISTPKESSPFIQAQFKSACPSLPLYYGQVLALSLEVRHGARGLGSDCEAGQRFASPRDSCHFAISIQLPYSLPYNAVPRSLLDFLIPIFKVSAISRPELTCRALSTPIAASAVSFPSAACQSVYCRCFKMDCRPAKCLHVWMNRSE
jgi:hypothetical protein